MSAFLPYLTSAWNTLLLSDCPAPIVSGSCGRDCSLSIQYSFSLSTELQFCSLYPLKNMEQLKPSNTAGGDVKWPNNFQTVWSFLPCKPNDAAWVNEIWVEKVCAFLIQTLSLLVSCFIFLPEWTVTMMPGGAAAILQPWAQRLHAKGSAEVRSEKPRCWSAAELW